MKKFNLFNNQQKIGEGKKNQSALSFLSKKPHKMVAALMLSTNIGLTLLSGCSGQEIKEDNTTVESLLDKGVIDLSGERYYVINGTDGEKLFVTSEYLNLNDYVPRDTIESRDKYLKEFFKGCEVEYQEKYPEKDFSEFMIQYGQYKVAYNSNEKSDYKNAYSRKRYIYSLQSKLIEMAEKHGIIYYFPPAISYDEYLEEEYSNRRDDKRVLPEYTIKEGDTVSGIADSIADNKDEFKEIYRYIIENNHIEDPDKIKAGDKISISNVGREDYQTLNVDDSVTPITEIIERMDFISKFSYLIPTIQGDTESEKLSHMVFERVNDCMSYYRTNKTHITDYNYEEFLDDLRDLCSNIENLTGEAFKTKLKEYSGIQR